MNQPTNSFQNVLFTCGREPGYPRNAFLIDGLSRYYQTSLITENSPSSPLRYLKLIGRLVADQTDHAVSVVGFYGHPLMLLSPRFIHKPVLFDAFVSTYDTLCYDRRWFKPSSLPGKLTLWLDRTSCKLADFVLLDTQAHADFFNQSLGIPLEKLRALFVGCDERIFFPRAVPDGKAKVLFYGSFLRLHGIDVIIRAAHQLKHLPFTLIGDGPEKVRMMRLAASLGCDNVTFRPSVSISQLPDEIASATICLGGHFSRINKAERVIAGKTYQCIAMGKATIVGENPANHELLTHGRDAWFCQMNDPQALAEAIQFLYKTPEMRFTLGKNAHETFVKRASWSVLSLQLRDIVNELIGKKLS